MIASLMMYARPELEVALAAYWARIHQYLREQGIDSPERLAQEAEPFSIWRHPQLVLSQTCGMPYRLYLHEQVKLVGTPDYGLQQCPAGYYRSAIIVRADDSRSTLDEFRQARFAYNQSHSQSGFAAAYWHLHSYGFWFSDRIETGAHRRSAYAVARRQADIACLDGLTWEFMQHYDAFASQLRVLAWTVPTPGLPYICAPSMDAASIYSAVARAIADLPPEVLSSLHIRSMVRISKADYLAVANPPNAAIDSSATDV